MTNFEIETWIKIIQADQEAQRQGFPSAFGESEEVYISDYDEYEYCWATGDYEGQDCEMCQHKFECAGYEGEK